MAQWLTFRLHGGEYALSVTDVREVLYMAAVARLPEAPPWFVGLLNLRGEVLPVLDLRVRLGLPASSISLQSSIIVVQAGGRPVGLVADEVIDVLSVSPQSATQPDDLGGVEHPIVRVAHVDGRLVMLLDQARVCDRTWDFSNWGEQVPAIELESEITSSSES